MFGNSLIGIAGLIGLLGPIKEKGDARSEKIGSIENQFLVNFYYFNNT